MKKAITFIIIVAISVLVGIASDNYWGGIITFVVLGLIALVVYAQMRAHGTKPIAREVLKKERPTIVELDKCINALGGSSIGDEETKELTRKLIAKRGQLEHPS